MPKRKPRRKTTLGCIAQRFADAPTREQLLRLNLIAHARALVHALRDQVDGVDGNPTLRHAIDSTVRACDLIEAQ